VKYSKNVIPIKNLRNTTFIFRYWKIKTNRKICKKFESFVEMQKCYRVEEWWNLGNLFSSHPDGALALLLLCFTLWEVKNKTWNYFKISKKVTRISFKMWSNDISHITKSLVRNIEIKRQNSASRNNTWTYTYNNMIYPKKSNNGWGLRKLYQNLERHLICLLFDRIQFFFGKRFQVAYKWNAL